MESYTPLRDGKMKSGCDMGLEDRKSARNMTFEDLYNSRYCEIFLICGDEGSPVYNTTGLNNEEDPKDTAPASIMANFSTEAVKEQYKVPGVSLNPPRYWLLDSIRIPTGTRIRDFAGLKARWMATLTPGATAGGQPYIPVAISRESTFKWKNGQTAFILDDPFGMPWIMKSYTNFVDKNLTYGSLSMLGKKLKLPPNWKFRTTVLPQDLLEVTTSSGEARLIQDELQNTYDACDDGIFNYKP